MTWLPALENNYTQTKNFVLYVVNFTSKGNED